jgi:hypothetical protein
MDPHRHGDDCICHDCISDALRGITHKHEARPDRTDVRMLCLFAIVLVGYLLLIWARP